MFDRASLIQDLAKALEGGQYSGAPGTLTQGSALQVENLAEVLYNVCFEDRHLILQRLLKEKPCRATLVQFDRQLSYGQFGGSAQLEGAMGLDDTLDVVRITVPMCYYSQQRSATLVADLVDTVDGVSGSDRQAEAAAKVIAGDVEFDLFRGCDLFQNGGLYDGNPLALADMANMRGLFLQVRASDSDLRTQDAMFAEYGSDETVVINKGAALDQDVIENAHMRSSLNMGEADLLLVDPRVLSQYNKLSYSISRIMLGNSAQDATGSDLSRQWTSGGQVQIRASRFLSGKTAPARPRAGVAGAPTISPASVTVAGVVTPFVINEVYKIFATAGNEIGESRPSATSSLTIAATGDEIQTTVTPSGTGTSRWFNLYRSAAGGTKAMFLGRIRNSGAATTVFLDLGNRKPGGVTGVLLQGDTWEIAELAPYSRLKLGVFQLAKPEAHFRFCTLKGFQPRKNVLIDNLTGVNFDR